MAIDYLKKCLEVSTPDESHLRKAYALLVGSLSQAERHDEAWQTCQNGLALYADDKELLFRSAILHHHFGRLQEAAETYLRILNGHEARHFSSIDQGLAGFKARHNLAIVYDDMGQLEQAEQQWRLISEEVPDYVASWRGLGDVLFRQNRLADLEALSLRLLTHRCRLRREGLILQGRLAAARGDLVGAVTHLREADSAGHGDLEPLQVLCRLLFEHGEPEAAAFALEELCARDTQDAAAHHNLGVTYLRQQNRQAAIQSLSRSLELRPNAPATQRQLESALQMHA